MTLKTMTVYQVVIRRRDHSLLHLRPLFSERQAAERKIAFLRPVVMDDMVIEEVSVELSPEAK